MQRPTLAGPWRARTGYGATAASAVFSTTCASVARSAVPSDSTWPLACARRPVRQRDDLRRNAEGLHLGRRRLRDVTQVLAPVGERPDLVQPLAHRAGRVAGDHPRGIAIVAAPGYPEHGIADDELDGDLRCIGERRPRRESRHGPCHVLPQPVPVRHFGHPVRVPADEARRLPGIRGIAAGECVRLPEGDLARDVPAVELAEEHQPRRVGPEVGGMRDGV